MQRIDRSDDAVEHRPADAGSLCSRRDVQKSGDTVTIDSTCALAGETASSHAVVTASFNNAYTMTVTSQKRRFTGR
jgi:hypothetical protein